MTRPISIADAEHYTWGDACDGWHLLRSPDLSVVQERVPAGAGEVMHFHKLSCQFFYILEGEGTIALEQQEFALHQGHGLEIAPGVLHRFCNRTLQDVVFLVISRLPSHGDRVDL